MPKPRGLEKLTALLGWLVVGGFVALPAASAEDVPFYGSGAVGFHNQYNFRGFKAGDWAPSIAFDFIVPLEADSGLALDAGWWYVDPIDDVYNEAAAYTYLLLPVGALQLRVGGIFFGFPDEGWITGEFGLAVSYPLLDFVELELAWWSDVKGKDYPEDKLGFGHYAELRAEKSIELKNWLSVELAAGVSYTIDYYRSDGWNHVFATADCPIGLSETLTLIPYVGGTIALEGLEEAGEKDQFLAGIRLAVEF